MESSFERLSRSKLFMVGEIIWDLLILSLLWVICSLPLVTIGASSSALYFAVHRRFALGYDTPSKDFLRSFKLNIKQGLITGIIFLLYAGASAFNIRVAVFGFGELTLPDWYFPVSLLLLLPLFFACPMTFPYIARFNNDTKHLLINSTLLSVMNPGRTLLIWFYTLTAAALMVFFPPAALIAPAGFTFLIMRTAEKSFAVAKANEERRQNGETDNDA
ncbi:MAG: YesL family protein [Clostridiales bacterium]|nr:YesL family protein [Clostridiales bacterium]